MKRQSPLATGLLYIILGILFVALAIDNVERSGWNWLSYFIIFLATIDLGSGIRFIMLHYRLKRLQKNNKQS